MKIDYRVHSVAAGSQEREVKLDGKLTTGVFPTLVVELVSDDPGQTNPTLNVPAGDIDEAANLFKVGAAITATFARKGK